MHILTRGSRANYCTELIARGSAHHHHLRSAHHLRRPVGGAHLLRVRHEPLDALQELALSLIVHDVGLSTEAEREVRRRRMRVGRAPLRPVRSRRVPHDLVAPNVLAALALVDAGAGDPHRPRRVPDRAPEEER